MSALPQPAGKTTLSLRSPGQRGYEKEKRSQGKLPSTELKGGGRITPPPPPTPPLSTSWLHSSWVRCSICLVLHHCVSKQFALLQLRWWWGAFTCGVCVCVCMLVVVGGPFLWEPSGPRPEPLNVRSSRPQPTPELQACT